MTSSLIIGSALLLALQGQAAPQTDDTDTKEEVSTAAADDKQAVAETAAVDDKDKIICRRTQVIGTKFKKRICGTQAEWDQLARRGQISTAEFQAKGAGIRQATGQ